MYIQYFTPLYEHQKVFFFSFFQFKLKMETENNFYCSRHKIRNTTRHTAIFILNDDWTIDCEFRFDDFDSFYIFNRCWHPTYRLIN